MNPIPQKLRNEMAADPFYKECCLTGTPARFEKVDWHHCWKFAGKQINEKWAIVPVWWYMHSPLGSPESVHNCRMTEIQIKLISLGRATKEDLAKYPMDWDKERKRLEYELNEKKVIHILKVGK